MKLRIDFGYNGTIKIVQWPKSLDDFPKLMRFEGNNYEWFMYEKDKTGDVDYSLVFVRIKSYDPNYFATMVDFDSLLTNVVGESCECGAKHTSFPQIHMLFCPKWRRKI